MRLLCLLLALVALKAARASDLDFVLANKTKRDFEAVYVTAVDDKDWNGNLLKNGTALKPGGTVQVRFPGKETFLPMGPEHRRRRRTLAAISQS